MKRKTGAINKIPKLFKLHKPMISLLKRESKRTNRTQTRIVEMALTAYFAVKR